MAATVHFATNRVVNPPGDSAACYTDTILPSADPAGLTYGCAFVDDANFNTGATGAITNITLLSKGGFDPGAAADLAAPGRNLLVFIHGFANSFNDAVVRAAFNQQWFAQGGSDSSVVAFCWPSLGRVLIDPSLDAAYDRDQAIATQSAAHLQAFLAAVLPIATRARASGVRVNLLAHSMGNWALAGAVQAWFTAGAAADLFDTAILAAADEPWSSFGLPIPQRLSQLRLLTRRTAILYSIADQVLEASYLINGAQRLGQTGPRDANNPAACPPDCFDLMDCSGFHDYPGDLASSHQYYRLSQGVRARIATVL